MTNVAVPFACCCLFAGGRFSAFWMATLAAIMLVGCGSSPSRPSGSTKPGGDYLDEGPGAPPPIGFNKAGRLLLGRRTGCQPACKPGWDFRAGTQAGTDQPFHQPAL